MSSDPTVSLAAASLTFSVLSFITIVIGLLFLVFPGWLETIKTATSSVTGSSSGGLVDSIKVFAVLGGALAPDIVLLIGFISDLMNMKFRFSVTSLIGIFAVIVHWGIGSMVFGSAGSGVLQQMSQAASNAAAAIAPGPSAPSISPGNPTNPSLSSQLLGVGTTTPTVLSALGKKAEKAKTDAEFATARAAALEKAATASSVGTPSTLDLNDSPDAAMARKTRSAAKKSAAATTKMAAQGKLGGAQLPSMIADKFNPCAIRGLGMFDIKGSPMGLAALAAVFSVYFLDMTAGKKRTTNQIGGYLGFSTLTLLFNIYAYREFGCFQDPSMMGIVKSSVFPLVTGFTIGGIGYSVLKSKYVDFLPLDGQVLDTGAATGSGSSIASDNKPSCSAPNDDDQMVCEAYQDGKRITSVSLN